MRAVKDTARFVRLDGLADRVVGVAQAARCVVVQAAAAVQEQGRRREGQRRAGAVVAWARIRAESFFVLGLPHVTLIELRLALISYQKLG